MKIFFYKSLLIFTIGLIFFEIIKLKVGVLFVSIFYLNKTPTSRLIISRRINLKMSNLDSYNRAQREGICHTKTEHNTQKTSKTHKEFSDFFSNFG